MFEYFRWFENIQIKPEKILKVNSSIFDPEKIFELNSRSQQKFSAPITVSYILGQLRPSFVSGMGRNCHNAVAFRQPQQLLIRVGCLDTTALKWPRLAATANLPDFCLS